MIPLLVAIRIDGPIRLRLWLPLFLLWILLLPFVLLLLPFAALVLLVRGERVASVLPTLLAGLCAIRGTHVEIRAPGNSVLVHVW